MWCWLRIIATLLPAVMLVFSRDSSELGWQIGLVLSTISFVAVFIGALFYDATRAAFNPHKSNWVLPYFSADPFDSRVIWQANHFFRYFFLGGAVSQLLVGNLQGMLLLFSVSAGFYLSYRFLCRMNADVLVQKQAEQDGATNPLLDE